METSLPKSAVLELLRAIMRPLIRTSLKNLVSFQEFTDVARDEFIAEAKEIIHAEGEALNMSRISVLTGIHRREIKTGIERTSPIEQKPAGAITRVLHLWRTRADFLTPNGSPRALECRGVDNDFRRLVREAAVSVDAGAILKELLRLGYVIKEDHHISLKAEANIFSGKENLTESYDYLEQEIENLMNASVENIFTKSSQDPSHVLLRTSFDNIPPEKMHEIKIWFRRRAELLHEEVRTYISLFDRDTAPSTAKLEASGKVEATFSSISFTRRIP